VVEELDNFKKSQDMLGQNARRVSNAIDALKTRGSLQDGVPLEHAGTLRVAFNGNANLIPLMLQGEKSGYAHFGVCDCQSGERIQARGQGKTRFDAVVLVSKDTNLRIKAEALGIRAQDYENDRIPDISNLYGEARNIEMPLEVFSALAGDGETEAAAVKAFEVEVNECFVARCGTSSILARHSAVSGAIVNLSRNGDKDVHGILPKKQRAAVRPRTADGSGRLPGNPSRNGRYGKNPAGAGGGAEPGHGGWPLLPPDGLPAVFPMGKDLGYLPGDIAEKINPWMQPIFDNIACLYGAYKPGKRGKAKASVPKGKG